MTKHEGNNSFDEIADRLKKAGFQTIQFDLPTEHGELPLSKRAKVVENVAAKYSPDGVLAQSYGATTVLASHLPSVRSQVLVSPGLSMIKTIREVFESRGVTINFEGDTLLPRSTGQNTIVGKKFWDELRDWDDIAYAKKVTIPTCILHGDNDPKIPVATVQEFYNAVTIQPKMLKIFSGGDHGFIDVPRPMREEFLNDVVNWFKETL